MNFIKSIFRSFKKAWLTDEEVKKLKKQYPRTVKFFKYRLDRTKFTGLPLTLLVCIFLYVLFAFVDVVRDFMTFAPVVASDMRVNILLYAFRSPDTINVFLWITLLGEVVTVAVFVLITSAILWITQKKWQIIALWFTIISSEAVTFLLKILFHRTRPANAVILETSNSFPSGHATIAVAFYGFIVYLLLKKIKKNKYRIPVFIFFLLLIFAIGFSRLYLGVHYVSDVSTGYLVGLLGLVCGIGISENEIFQAKLDGFEKKQKPYKYSNILSVFLISIALAFYVLYGFLHQPEFLPTTSTSVEAIT